MSFHVPLALPARTSPSSRSTIIPIAEANITGISLDYYLTVE